MYMHTARPARLVSRQSDDASHEAMLFSRSPHDVEAHGLFAKIARCKGDTPVCSPAVAGTVTGGLAWIAFNEKTVAHGTALAS